MTLRGSDSHLVSARGGAVTATITSNVATLTATDISPRVVYLQAAFSNASAVLVNINAAASVVGIVVPRATGSAPGEGLMEIPIASLTALQFYGEVDSDTVNVMYRD